MTSELKPDLSSFGYADGGYMSKCRHCKETFLGAKRSWSCEPCAIKKILEPKITRAVPDVPELVRYGLLRETLYCLHCGEGMSGDGYKTPLHCPTVDVIGEGHEPDCNPIYCQEVETSPHSNAVYTAPVVEDIDLKAENERLREALRLNLSIVKLQNGNLYDDINQIIAKGEAALNPSEQQK